MHARPSFRVPRKRRPLGQSMVEFALVAPIFFALMVGVIDGGLCLYSVNAAANTANRGSEMVAAYGDFTNVAPPIDNADSRAVQWMVHSGLGGVGLSKATGYWIFKTDASSNLVQDAVNCPDNLSGRPANLCYDHFDASGNWDSSSNWLPTSRSVTTRAADYGELEIDYTYQWFFGTHAVIPMRTTRFFRVEPQQ